MKKNNGIYTTIGIVGLVGIIGFVIYLVGNFICCGVYEIHEMINNNNNANIDSGYIDTNNNQYNRSSPPVKGIDYKDSLDSLHIPHVIFDKELNCYAISLAGNNPEDIDNYDELVEQMNRLEYDRNMYKDCTIEDAKLVGAHCTGNIHQEAEAIRYNLSRKANPYDTGYDAGYDTGYDTGYDDGYDTAKRELENK